jgi:hypothetical protein
MGEKTEVDERPKERKNQRTGVDVLDPMLVTATVFHLERSALKAPAEPNTAPPEQKKSNDQKG